MYEEKQQRALAATLGDSAGGVISHQTILVVFGLCGACGAHRVSGRRGPPSPPGGGRGLEPRSLSRRGSPASAPGDARTLRRGLGPRLSDEASLWLVPSTPVARVFFWIGAIEGRPELTGLVITASLSGIAGGPARARPGKPPVCACLVLVGEW